MEVYVLILRFHWKQCLFPWLFTSILLLLCQVCSGVELSINKEPVCSNYEEDGTGSFFWSENVYIKEFHKSHLCTNLYLYLYLLYYSIIIIIIIAFIMCYIDIASNVGRAGRWSSENCRKVKSEGGRTVCECSQLGHFGLLFVS